MLEQNTVKVSDIENIKRSIASSIPVDFPQANQLKLLSNRLESLERENRKTKITITGLFFKSKNHYEETKQFLKEKFGVMSFNVSIKQYNKRVIVDLFNPSLKADILKMKKAKLIGAKIFIDSDRTPKERTIDWNIRQFIKNNFQQSSKITRKGNRVVIDNLEYTWSDEESSLVLQHRGVPPGRHNINQDKITR